MFFSPHSFALKLKREFNSEARKALLLQNVTHLFQWVLELR